MSAEMPRCPRRFEVEAARDGRLAGPELQRFGAHLQHCAPCAREAQSFEQLGRALRSLPPVTADDLHVRRERVRLLAAFDSALVRRGEARRWLVPLVVTAALTTLALLLWQGRSEVEGPAPVITTAVRDPIAVEAQSDARWSRQVEAHRETITLSSGTLSISIDHGRAPRRLRVLLPDGELEDLGTTFSVTARDATTTHVAVREGAVILRLRDRAPIVLNAQDSWSRAAEAAVAAAPPVAASVDRPVAPPRASASGRAWPPPSAPAVAVADPAGDFRDALSALNAGDNARASGLFAAFLARHPAAPNAEDAAYLRVIALQRAGNAAGMRDAARSYLARYPTAFRRSEIEPLAE